MGLSLRCFPREMRLHKVPCLFVVAVSVRQLIGIPGTLAASEFRMRYLPLSCMCGGDVNLK